MATAAEQLVEVQAAISAVLTRGQSVELNGRRMTRANLEELRDMERKLKFDISREDAGGIKLRRGVPID